MIIIVYAIYFLVYCTEHFQNVVLGDKLLYIRGILMIIIFCGHSNCLFSDDVKEELKNILVGEITKNPTCKFYLGGMVILMDCVCVR